MLGNEVKFAGGVAPEQGHTQLSGLGLLDMKTSLQPNDQRGQRLAKTMGTGGFWSQVAKLKLTGYQLDCGCITYGPQVEQVIRTEKEVLGVAGPGTDVWGTTLHGLFKNYHFTLPWINYLRNKKGLAPLEAEQLKHLENDPYDQVAAHVRQHLDMAKIYKILGV